MIKRINLDQSGICLFVGHLEALLMRTLWDIDKPQTMAQVYRYLVANNAIELSYSTIITTLNRLATKQLIVRTERENSTPLWSSAFHDETHFIEVCMIDTLNTLRNNYEDHFNGYIGA